MTTREELETTHDRIRDYIHRTPVMTSTTLNELVGADVFLKCENFQRMGAFKMRGATNAILSLTDEERKKGVVTHSSGNFAQAVALAGKLTGTEATIVMPENAPPVKKNAVISYGATIIECESTAQAREAMAEKVKEETGATFLHPSDQIEVINGNATAAIELMEEVGNLDAILTPVGGGGLIAGTALAAHHFGEQTKVFGGEPEGADDAKRSLDAGHVIPIKNAQTIADGLRTYLGEVNFPIIKELVSDIFLVTDEEIIEAMKFIWERMKIIIEPSSAVPIAALMNEKASFNGDRIGVIISGGNVDLYNLPF